MRRTCARFVADRPTGKGPLMNSAFFKQCPLAMLLAIVIISVADAAGPLNVQFANGTGLADDEVFITVQNRAAGVTDTNITYAGGTKLTFGQTKGTTNIMSNCVSLKTIGKHGLTVNYLDGGIVFVSYGAALTATNNVPS